MNSPYVLDKNIPAALKAPRGCCRPRAASCYNTSDVGLSREDSTVRIDHRERYFHTYATPLAPGRSLLYESAFMSTTLRS